MPNRRMFSGLPTEEAAQNIPRMTAIRGPPSVLGEAQEVTLFYSLRYLRDMNTIGSLMIRIGCWGMLYYNHNKEPPQEYR